LLHLRYNLTGQRESIFAMILSARAIASEIADSDAGEFLPSHCVNFRAARIQAAIRITRFLPSSTTMSVTYSLFVRYNYIRLLISDFGNLHAGSIGRLLGLDIILDFDCSSRQRTRLRNISLVTDGGFAKKSALEAAGLQASKALRFTHSMYALRFCH
jgi:hypothetical protein